MRKDRNKQMQKAMKMLYLHAIRNDEICLGCVWIDGEWILCPVF